MRISDWSSDVCSSDLPRAVSDGTGDQKLAAKAAPTRLGEGQGLCALPHQHHFLGAGGMDRDRVAQVVEGDAPLQRHREALSSDERRVGKEYVSTCRSLSSPDHSKKNLKQVKTPKQ